MIRIGVTGGIGSGKSTFCTQLYRFGAELFNADSEAAHIMESNPEVQAQLKSLLGDESYDSDGKINRAFISQIAFSDRKVLDAIGKIVHPLVQEAFAARAAIAERSGCPAIVREAAVNPDAMARQQLDIVVSVLADNELRMKRVIERSQLTRPEVQARMAAQPSNEEYALGSDQVIWNNGSLAELADLAERFWQTYIST